MKKTIISALLFVAAGIAFTGCVKEEVIDSAATTGRIIKGLALAPETRVDVVSSDESNVSLEWATGDELDIHGFAGTAYSKSTVASDYSYSGKNIEFSFEEISGADTYYASHPKGAVTVNDQYNEFIVNIPAKQTPTQKFVDPAAILLLSGAVNENGDGTATFSLSHSAAYAKMLVKSNEPIQSATITSITTNNSKSRYGIAGQYWIYYNGDNVGNNEPGTNSVVSTSIDITAPAEGFAKEGDFYAVWFALIPQELTAFSVNITTESGTVTKKISVDGEPLAFAEGKAKSFKVDMTNIKEATTTYTLITDADDFEDGGQYILTGKVDGVYYYMGAVTNNKFNSAAIPVSGNKITTDDLDCVWEASFTGKQFTLKNLEAEQYVKYVSGTNINFSTDITDNEKWTITYENGEFKVANVSSTGRAIMFNGSVFGGYATSNYQKTDSNSIYYSGLTIFKKDVPAVPKIKVEQETLNVAAAGDTDDMTVTVTDYTGTVTVDITYDNGSDWVDAKWSDNVLTYLIDENEEETPRTAYITIKASNDNGEASKTITVNQKAASNGQTQEYVDILDNAFTGITGTAYTSWSNKQGSSSEAVYAGYSAGQYSSIQLRSSGSNEGVVSTTSGGKVTKISVKWNTNTANNRTLNVYGKNTAYTSAADLFKTDGTQGTLIGTIVNGTSTELEIEDDYTFIGFRSANNALYLDEVQITWEN